MCRTNSLLADAGEEEEESDNKDLAPRIILTPHTREFRVTNTRIHKAANIIHRLLNIQELI
jgi:NAD(P)H-hydrate repair Nnr-like enzyme with NAD(P)H-hydrate dehydratase domain